MALQLGVDTGGTFTDFVLYDEGTQALTAWKVLSTPGDPAVLVTAVDAVLADNRYPDFVRPICQAATIIAMNSSNSGTSRGVRSRCSIRPPRRIAGACAKRSTKTI
jgi:N-methylhydantoinase A/oxoprolinase/acetone carboxylase beta subunit